MRMGREGKGESPVVSARYELRCQGMNGLRINGSSVREGRENRGRV